MVAAQNAFAAVLRGRHLHLSALTHHHAAARAFFRRHLRARSRTRHRGSRQGPQQQQNRSELAQSLHVIGGYPAPTDAATRTTEKASPCRATMGEARGAAAGLG